MVHQARETLRGRVVDEHVTRDGDRRLLVELDDGRRVLASPDLVRGEIARDGRVELAAGQGPVQPVIELAQEELRVGKRVRERAVRVNIHVTEREETVDPPLVREEVAIERVAVDREVEDTPSVRQEGDVVIVPVLEEVLVVRKALMLREELHIRRTRSEVHEPQTVTLRKEEAQIDRLPPE